MACSAATVVLDHISSGCNRVAGCLDWGEGGLIAYGAHNAVVIYDPHSNRVLTTALGHTDIVNCVRWLTAADFGLPCSPPSWPLCLASGSGDGTICLWLINTSTNQPWTLAARLEAHTAPVTSVSLLRFADTLLLVSTGGDGDVVIWESSRSNPKSLAHKGAWKQSQRLQFGTRLQHCCALSTLPSDTSCAFLALGGVDGHVRLFTRHTTTTTGNDDKFTQVCDLTGHQNWVRGLAFTPRGRGLLLASASQDKYIRLWNVGPEGVDSAEDPASASQALLMKYAPRPKFQVGGREFTATLEALLIGHEDWVHSVAWRPVVGSEESKESEALCLLSASMDRTMMMWVPDKASGLWLSQESVGDAGVNHLGYYTGVWSPNGDAIVAHGFTGALHIWRRTERGLEPQHGVGGHYGAIVDASWAADGGCLLTVSCDQTARMTTFLTDGRWCEIARPQVHGHDFSCVAAIPSLTDTKLDDKRAIVNNNNVAQGPYLHVSGSEEKVLRVFEAPGAFQATLALARGLEGAHSAAAAYGATLPALGLSNKAFYSEEANNDSSLDAGNGELGGLTGGFYGDGSDFAPSCAPAAVQGPPLEEHLSQNTLWPEIHKLYGHGNEVYCLASDPQGDYLASASRAQSTSTADIILWDITKWSACANLSAHSLTVTQLAFSPDGGLLASVSRDRSVAVFARVANALSKESEESKGKAPFALVSHQKAHSRIVWGVAWSPDTQLLFTASRDARVNVWGVDPQGALTPQPLCSVTLGDSVRSVAVAPCVLGEKRYLVAAGMENGDIELAVVGKEKSVETMEEVVHWNTLWKSSCYEKHAAAVRRLCWRQVENKVHAYQLASCGDDHAIRILSIECKEE